MQLMKIASDKPRPAKGRLKQKNSRNSCNSLTKKNL